MFIVSVVSEEQIHLGKKFTQNIPKLSHKKFPFAYMSVWLNASLHVNLNKRITLNLLRFGALHVW